MPLTWTMPRRFWDLDATFSARHRASFPFRQRISNLIQTDIFARLTHSRKSDLGCRVAIITRGSARLCQLCATNRSGSSAAADATNKDFRG